MPRYDRSGPIGEGPMSGWGQGLCGSKQADQAPTGYRQMAGKGREGGFGFRGGAGRRAGMRSISPRMEGDGDNLKSQVEELRKSLTAIEQQLARINQKDD